MDRESMQTQHVVAECHNCGFFGKGVDTPSFRKLWQEHMEGHGIWADDTWVVYVEQTGVGIDYRGHPFPEPKV